MTCRLALAIQSVDEMSVSGPQNLNSGKVPSFASSSSCSARGCA
jgi:hypothetical protein